MKEKVSRKVVVPGSHQLPSFGSHAKVLGNGFEGTIFSWERSSDVFQVGSWEAAAATTVMPIISDAKKGKVVECKNRRAKND